MKLQGPLFFRGHNQFPAGLAVKKNRFCPALYTFDFHSDQLDLTNMVGRLGSLSWPLLPYLKGQPFPIVARVRNGPAFWHFELYHERRSEADVQQQTHAL